MKNIITTEAPNYDRYDADAQATDYLASITKGEMPNGMTPEGWATLIVLSGQKDIFEPLSPVDRLYIDNTIRDMYQAIDSSREAYEWRNSLMADPKEGLKFLKSMIHTWETLGPRMAIALKLMKREVDGYDIREFLQLREATDAFTDALVERMDEMVEAMKLEKKDRQLAARRVRDKARRMAKKAEAEKAEGGLKAD